MMKNNTKKESLAKKYFKQQKSLAYDVTAILLAVVGLLVHIFGFKISFLGIPMIAAGVVVKFYDLFTIIKDKEFDDYMEDLKERNIVIYPEERPDFIMELYDACELPLKVGRNQNIRSNIYSLTGFYLEKDHCRIIQYKVRALENSVSLDEYKIPLTAKYEVIETPTTVPGRHMTYLIIKTDKELKFPVKNSSYDLEEFLKNFR